ncbi:hypothetical protein [Paenibacillus xylanexedens]|uniref:hypothetical protein n=1 Tax=Paenibacillus xylanexedens TaxID=528191 RepID=UPI003D03C87B
MRKICYLMHVDWDWIKQRPHFISEGLSENYQVDIFFVRNYLNMKKNSNNTLNAKIASKYMIKKVPLSSRFSLLKVLERLINHKVYKMLESKEYDIVWTTSPVILDFVDLKKLKKRKLVYDCMDDVIEFYEQQNQKVEYLNKEKSLIQCSDLIITSSDNLKDKMVERGASGAIHVINNAYDKELVPARNNEVIPTAGKRILYIGTISNWFDFNIILKILDKYSDVMLLLAGPTDIKIPKHKSIEYIGVISHDKLFALSQTVDALIMPFQVNKLIESVDPVKVYEYIAFRKPTIVVEYGETLKFSEFVYLYKDYNSLEKIIKKLKDGQLAIPSLKEVEKFLEGNTWEKRAIQIQTLLEKI